MRPISLVLRNAIGIRCGLGLEVLTLDLTKIPADAAVIAIKADNGGGKSTLLNLGLHPWREPPMLHGTIYDQFDDGEGGRNLFFEHDGVRYSSEILIKKTAKTKTMRAFLTTTDDNAPYRMADGTESDGKTVNYDRCLEDILGPKALFFLSAFRAQRADKLAEVKDPKELMNSLLDLSEPTALLKGAKTVARDFVILHEAAREVSARAEKNATRLAETRRAVEWQAESNVTARERAQAADDALIAATVALESVKGDSAAMDAKKAHKAALLNEREKARDRDTAAAAAFHEQDHQAHRAHENEVAEVKQRIADNANTTLSAQGQRRSWAALIEQADKIEAAVNALPGLAQGVEAALEAADAAKKVALSLTTARGRVSEVSSSIAALGRIGRLAKERHAGLSQRAGFVQQVPCNGEGEYADCPALADAQSAANDLSAAEAELAKLRAEYTTTTEDLAAARLAIQDYESKLDPNADTVLSSLRQRLVDTQALAGKQELLAAAQKTIAAHDVEIVRLEQEIEPLKKRLEMIEERFINRSAQREKAHEAQTEQMHTEARLLQSKIDALPADDENKAHEQAVIALDAARGIRDKTAEMLAAGVALLANERAEAARLKTAVDEAEEDVAREKALAEEVSTWKLLARGLQGVIDLTIEDAGPAIAEIANSLLLDAYGPRFSVRIATQREQANGAIVEDFSIVVLDSDTGATSSVLHKSGGEAVWIDKALTDAVAIYYQEASGKQYETAFADETEDGLTQERKAQYYKMDRAALLRGGFRRKFHVSHDPQAWELADHVIDLGEWKCRTS